MRVTREGGYARLALGRNHEGSALARSKISHATKRGAPWRRPNQSKQGPSAHSCAKSHLDSSVRPRDDAAQRHARVESGDSATRPARDARGYRFRQADRPLSRIAWRSCIRCGAAVPWRPPNEHHGAADSRADRGRLHPVPVAHIGAPPRFLSPAMSRRCSTSAGHAYMKSSCVNAGRSAVGVKK